MMGCFDWPSFHFLAFKEQLLLQKETAISHLQAGQLHFHFIFLCLASLGVFFLFWKCFPSFSNAWMFLIPFCFFGFRCVSSDVRRFVVPRVAFPPAEAEYRAEEQVGKLSAPLSEPMTKGNLYIYMVAPPKIYLFKLFLSSKMVFSPGKTLFFLRRLVALHLNSIFKMPIPILGGGTI